MVCHCAQVEQRVCHCVQVSEEKVVPKIQRSRPPDRQSSFGIFTMSEIIFPEKSLKRGRHVWHLLNQRESLEGFQTEPSQYVIAHSRWNEGYQLQSIQTTYTHLNAGFSLSLLCIPPVNTVYHAGQMGGLWAASYRRRGVDSRMQANNVSLPRR